MSATSMTGSERTGREWSEDIPVRYVSQVIHKLEDGTYPTEPTRCFCGCEPNDTVLVELDRHTIPHRMVLCENCLLIRANPRMTEEAYTAFYNNEYRKIYDGFPYQANSENDDYLFEEMLRHGTELRELLQSFDIDPQSIIDVGCDKGAMVMPYVEEGRKVYGIELCDRSRAYAALKGIETVATIDELIAKGIRAELVIMCDFVEHLLDLRDIGKVRDLLTPQGYVFIYTPGLLSMHPARLFQNAHTYQFIGATLEYIMERLGFEAEILDERIVSVWRYTGKVKQEAITEPEWGRFIWDQMNQVERRAIPPVRTRCKFTAKTMLENLEANLAHKIPAIEHLKDRYNGSVVIVGGGPSVDGQIEKIRELTDKGIPSVVIDRMYPWCAVHNFKPTFVVSLDASEGVEEGFTNIHQDTIHLLVSTTNPKLFECLNGHKKYIWSGAAGSLPEAIELWRKYGYHKMIVVNTGGSVTLASVFLSLFMGFRSIHLFGFDCMTELEGHDYATGISGESVERKYFEVEVGEESGEKILTCATFLAFAQQFFAMIEMARQRRLIDSIDVYGKSLVNAMLTGKAERSMTVTMRDEPTH